MADARAGFFPHQRSVAYPKHLRVDFRKLRVPSLRRYLEALDVPARPDASAAEVRAHLAGRCVLRCVRVLLLLRAPPTPPPPPPPPPPPLTRHARFLSSRAQLATAVARHFENHLEVDEDTALRCVAAGAARRGACVGSFLFVFPPSPRRIHALPSAACCAAGS